MTFNDPPDFGPGSAAEITATLQLPASELALDIVYVAGESKCVIRAEFPTAGAKRTARRYALPSNRLPAVLRWAADSSESNLAQRRHRAEAAGGPERCQIR